MRDKMPLKAFATLFLVLPLMMCGDPKGMNEQNTKLNNTIEKQNLLASKLDVIEKSQTDLSNKLTSLNTTLTQLSNQVKNLAEKPSQPNTPPSPGKPLDIPIGDSFVYGPDNAKVTITEWMDFQ